MLDSLPKRPWKSEACIVNLDKQTGPGTHWVCFRKNENDVNYFDSYGDLQPPLEVMNYLDGCHVSYNRTAFQSIKRNTDLCGHLCLAFLLYHSTCRFR